jgi:hypothetical protein
VDSDAVDRARQRLEALRSQSDGADLAATVERAREQLESFAQATADLEATLPDRVSNALHESMRAEVVPVARQLAEVRGLSAQTIRRLEGLHADVAAERRARVEDLALLVDLISSGWRSVERRLDRLERTFDRLERTLEDRAPGPGPVVRLEERRGPGLPAS